MESHDASPGCRYQIILSSLRKDDHEPCPSRLNSWDWHVFFLKRWYSDSVQRPQTLFPWYGYVLGCPWQDPEFINVMIFVVLRQMGQGEPSSRWFEFCLIIIIPLFNKKIEFWVIKFELGFFNSSFESNIIEFVMIISFILIFLSKVWKSFLLSIM